MSNPEPTTFNIRAPKAADCPAAAACQIAAWLETYATSAPPHVLAAVAAGVPERVASWQLRINQATLTTLLACARDDGRVVGFAVADTAAGATGRKELHSLYVLKAWQGQGVGKRLMDGVLGGEDTRAEVWLFEGNVTARRWYERCGFEKEVVGRRVKDGLEMWEVMLVRE